MALQQAVWLFMRFPHSFTTLVTFGKTNGHTELTIITTLKVVRHMLYISINQPKLIIECDIRRMYFSFIFFFFPTCSPSFRLQFESPLKTLFAVDGSSLLASQRRTIFLQSLILAVGPGKLWFPSDKDLLNIREAMIRTSYIQSQHPRVFARLPYEGHQHSIKLRTTYNICQIWSKGSPAISSSCGYYILSS